MRSLAVSLKAFLFIGIMLLSLQGFSQKKNKIDYFRPYNQDGINMFETTKESDTEFTGVKVKIGGNFAQQFQGLSHENKADEMLDENGYNMNKLEDLVGGFNLATANLNIDVQLDEGIRLNLVTYLSSRHHPEAWVKGGYIQVDKLPFIKNELVNNLMDLVTVKVGHMEVNYGDAHFRRTDNGNALYNPFVGNYILDAFSTEIGGEVYFQYNGFIGMVGITGGEIKGDIVAPTSPPADNKAARSPSYLVKLGYDNQVTEALRVRLTGSMYTTPSSARNFLYNGDRSGSRYYLVMAPVGASTSSAFTTGRYNPVMMDKVTAMMGNVFVKYDISDFVAVELFGTYENTNGRMNFETDTRNVNQFAGDLIFRLGKKESLYIGGRYNKVNAEDLSAGDISIDRMAGVVGWFINKSILLKGEYVRQNYNDYPSDNILHQGQFDGFMIEAVVGF